MKKAKKVEYIEIKSILLGEHGVGKTNLINAAIGQNFQENTKATITCNYISKKYNINGTNYIMKIWDTAGLEKYRSLTKLFYKNSNIVIFVYDITRQKTFDELEFWTNELQKSIDNFYVKAIVGNKTDLFENEQVDEEVAKDYAKNKRSSFKLVSAKENPKDFCKFLEELLISYNKKISKEKKSNKIKLNTDNTGGPGTKGCCK